ncbi:DUF3341 domain-containing protein [Thalassoroseus pseudoceratinae]|uniref:DUF3341 domain-containing protein n=1 Tax=Thalassoroseus pseudoceratinae TaxID=2713176 RepID=UPI00197F82C7|nr:DUF3341 domain-containing protein [Thalassoroseus pseudoceratinae]
MATKWDPETYGLMAEFNEPEDLIAATRKAREHGYRWFESYSPFPVHGLSEAMGFRHTKLPLIVLTAGLLGGLGGFGLQYYLTVIEYPLNVGGRPLFSWPSFIPITFELTVLSAAFGAVLGMLGLNGLPRPHHPVFNISEFASASRDKFFLCLQSRDEKFQMQSSREFLESLEPAAIYEVPQ